VNGRKLKICLVFAKINLDLFYMVPTYTAIIHLGAGYVTVLAMVQILHLIIAKEANHDMEIGESQADENKTKTVFTLVVGTQHKDGIKDKVPIAVVSHTPCLMALAALAHQSLPDILHNAHKESSQRHSLDKLQLNSRSESLMAWSSHNMLVKSILRRGGGLAT